jgi:hypothetical protein
MPCLVLISIFSRIFTWDLSWVSGTTPNFYKEINIELNGVLEQTVPKSTASNIGLNWNDAIRLGFWF